VRETIEGITLVGKMIAANVIIQGIQTTRLFHTRIWRRRNNRGINS